jgi:hypothetical protein
VEYVKEASGLVPMDEFGCGPDRARGVVEA